jgi:hypothetical protein
MKHIKNIMNALSNHLEIEEFAKTVDCNIENAQEELDNIQQIKNQNDIIKSLLYLIFNEEIKDKDIDCFGYVYKYNNKDYLLVFEDGEFEILKIKNDSLKNGSIILFCDNEIEAITKATLNNGSYINNEIIECDDYGTRD